MRGSSLCSLLAVCAQLLASACSQAEHPALGQPGKAQAPASELVLYAATSLRPALDELEPLLEARWKLELVLNYGASGDLARQILAAGQADLFFSADELELQRLVQAGCVDAAAPQVFLGNQLALIVGRAERGLALESGTAASLVEAPVTHWSIGNPQTVPAGRYAKAWLVSIGAWEGLAARVVPALDARSALAAVASGAARAGIVYATDAALSDAVRVAYLVPLAAGPRIAYALAALQARPAAAQAAEVAHWMASSEVRPVFERHGFLSLAP